MKLLQPGAGIGAEFLGQYLLGPRVDLQRLGRAAVLPQHAHQLVPQPLPQRVVRQQRPQLRRQAGGRAAGRQVSFDP